MNYKIAQASDYVGNDYWKWRAWISSSESELDCIRSVDWILHPTFERSRVHTDDRANKFELSTEGWGTFRLRAVLELVGGKKIEISKFLELFYPDEIAEVAGSPAPNRSVDADEGSGATKGTLAAAGRRTVFVSYNSEDENAAREFGVALGEAGFDVATDSSVIAAGEPIQAALHRMIQRSDLVVGFVGSDYLSPSLLAELEWAHEADKRVLIVRKEGAKIPTPLRNSPNVQIIEQNVVDAVDQLVALSRETGKAEP